jgi:hypothetical protein
MAPEQLMLGVEVDARTDQFSLAVVLYELLAVEKPLGRAKSLHERNRKVPKAMSLAIDKALSPRPHERFPSMAAFLDALRSRSAALTSPAMVAGGLASIAVVGVLAVTFPTWSAGCRCPAAAPRRAIRPFRHRGWRRLC